MALLLFCGCDRPVDEAGVAEVEEGRLVVGETGDSLTEDRGVMLGDRTLVIDGFRGAIRLTGDEERTASLSFEKRARGQDEDAAARHLEDVHVDEEGDDQTFRFTMRSDQPELSSVDVEGSVPNDVPIQIELESGPVELSGVHGPVEVRLRNGAIRVAGASERIELETHNGAIELGMVGNLPEGEEVRLRTYNGDILLTLPRGNTGEIVAETSSGEIITRGLDFAERSLTPDGAGYRFTGVLNEGDQRYVLRTEHGNIILQEGVMETLPDPDERPRVIDQRRLPQEFWPTDPTPPVEPDTNDVAPDTLRQQ